MCKPHPNYRLVKIHRNYTVSEVAHRLGKHRNTVRTWIDEGLPTIDEKRPILIKGRDLVTFLQARRIKKKKTCQPGEMYCLRCRVPRFSANAMADYEIISETIGNLIGLCPECGTIMNRRVSAARLQQVRGELEITFLQGPRHISEIGQSSLNSEFRTEAATYASVQLEE